MADDEGENLELEGPDYLYEQIAEYLTAGIANGTYPLRTKIPSENEIMRRWRVSRPTARQAVAVLIRRGLVVARPGTGTFVISHPSGDDEDLPDA